VLPWSTRQSGELTSVYAVHVWRTLAFTIAICACTFGAMPATVRAAERTSADPLLTDAVVKNHALQARCNGCILNVRWIGATYPRMTVDGAKWMRTDKAARVALARAALAAASNVYLGEWAAADIYQRIFVVDARGAALLSFQP